jgi:hypothetical protein
MLFNTIMNNLNEADPLKVAILFLMTSLTCMIYLCMIVNKLKELIDDCR